MIICALDTTSEYGSLVVRINGVTEAQRTIRSPEGFAHVLFPAIEELVSAAGIVLSQIDCFAAASGPGAFTGVRVGLAAVKGLATALDKRAAGISNLRAAAAAGSAEKRAVILDARRGDIFGAVYDANLQLIGDEVVTTLEQWLSTLPDGDYELILPPNYQMPENWASSRFAEMIVRQAPRVLAEAVAVCAERDGARGIWQDPAALDANYVRRSDAELFWKDSYVPKT